MSVLHRRLAVAAGIAAAAIAVPAAALATGSGSPSGKPAPPRACATSACKSKASHADATKSPTRSRLAGLAASADLSTNRLQAGLITAKRDRGNTAAGIAAFAASTGVSTATAQRIVRAVFGTQGGHSLTGPASVRVLATRLGVSPSAAHRALERVGALSGNHGIDPASPAFAAIAHDLGVSPAQLVAGLGAVKQSMAGKVSSAGHPPGPVHNGSRAGPRGRRRFGGAPVAVHRAGA